MVTLGKNIGITHIVIGGHLLAMVLLVSTCNMVETESDLSGVVHFSGREFAGSETCSECHRAITDAHAQTPHFLTSRPANSESVRGSFDSVSNIFRLDDRLKVVMEKRDSGLFQTGFADAVMIGTKRMDITVGSGKKGQSYLYWENNSLFQLPVSYYTPLDTWCNSPGYPTDQILFSRNVPARCLECHSTYFKTLKTIGGRETFDPDQVMLGVDCERCHGPAADHVTFHRRRPHERKGKYIVNPAQLTRQQKLDNCALCHSGLRENLLPSFSFVVGKNLEDYFFPQSAGDSASPLDVHGNQYGLLSASKCFRMSSMDCSSCHNVHARETNNLELFSNRCLSCHSRQANNFCRQPEIDGLILSKNCIDCHMPALPSRKVFLQAPDSLESTPFLIRTHFIATYRDEVKSFLDKLEPKSGPDQ